MDEEIKKLLEAQNSLLLNIFTSQILLLVKQRKESLPGELKNDSSIEHEVGTIHRELAKVKQLVKQYYS